MKSSVVNTRHVARATRLVLFWPQAKGVNVDTGSRAVSVVLVRLNQVEVTTITFRKSVVAVELNFGRSNGVVAAVKKVKRRVKSDIPSGSKSGISYVGYSGTCVGGVLENRWVYIGSKVS